MTRLITTYLCFLATLNIAQPTAMDKYFAQVRAGKSPLFPDELLKGDNIKSSAERLPIYLNDSVAVVRERAYQVAKFIGKQSKTATTRAQAVRWLIAGARDESTGNVGLALNYLTSFSKNDFGKTGRDSLKALVNKDQPYLATLVKLTGFLEIKELENQLFNLSQESTLGRKERWACMLALARMGNASAEQDILNRVKRMPVSDAVVYQIFPDLIYTRSKVIFDYLVEALNNDAKNCQSASANDDSNIPCAYRIMEMLAPAVEGYPIKQDISGDLDTSDYVTALVTVRDWFKRNPNFKLVKETY